MTKCTCAKCILTNVPLGDHPREGEFVKRDILLAEHGGSQQQEREYDKHWSEQWRDKRMGNECKMGLEALDSRPVEAVLSITDQVNHQRSTM